MAQQLNLFDARFAPARLRFSARQGLLAMAGALLLCWGAAQGLHWAADQAQADAQMAQAGMTGLRSQVTTLAQASGTGPAGELDRLRTLDASQRHQGIGMAWWRWRARHQTSCGSPASVCRKTATPSCWKAA